MLAWTTFPYSLSLSFRQETHKENISRYHSPKISEEPETVHFLTVTFRPVRVVINVCIYSSSCKIGFSDIFVPTPLPFIISKGGFHSSHIPERDEPSLPHLYSKPSCHPSFHCYFLLPLYRNSVPRILMMY